MPSWHRDSIISAISMSMPVLEEGVGHRESSCISKSMSFSRQEEKKSIGNLVMSQNRCYSRGRKRKRASEISSRLKIDASFAAGREKRIGNSATSENRCHLRGRKRKRASETPPHLKIDVSLAAGREKEHRNQSRIIISMQIPNNTYPYVYSRRRKT